MVYECVHVHMCTHVHADALTTQRLVSGVFLNHSSVDISFCPAWSQNCSVPTKYIKAYINFKPLAY